MLTYRATAFALKAFCWTAPRSTPIGGSATSSAAGAGPVVRRRIIWPAPT